MILNNQKNKILIDVTKINYTSLSRGMFCFILLLIFYSFGTFGFLNLFGLRLEIQMIILSLIFGLITFVRFKIETKQLYYAVCFSVVFGIGGLINSNLKTDIIEGFILLFLIILFFSSNKKQILTLSKLLVISTFILSLFILVPFIYFLSDPHMVENSPNTNIYDGTKGNMQIYPHFITDWFTFTSGDGFTFLNKSIPRFKGYSNEPSATIVHYLAPSILGLILGRKYIFLGFSIILINIVAIGSFSTHLTVILSLVLFLLFRLVIFFPITSYLSSFLLVSIFLINFTSVEKALSVVSSFAISNIGLDLISRKITPNSLTGISNLELTQRGIQDGLLNILISPIGYSSSRLGPRAGLLYVTSSKMGWVGLIILLGLITKVLKRSYIIVNQIPNHYINYGLCLFMALILIIMFMSGYGWARPPGFIMILTLYKLIYFKSKSLNRNLI